MAIDNIFSGLKVLDLASFIAGPGAAVILADFGADVIKVEPPRGDTQRLLHMYPPLPRAKENYAWHLDNRNKRGMALDLKSPDAGKVLERLVKWADVLIVNFQLSTFRMQATQAGIRRCCPLEPSSDLRRPHRLWREGA